MSKGEKKTTTWRVATWQRKYRGVIMWVAAAYSDSPRWYWLVDVFERPDGRAKSRISAMRAAMARVDEEKAGGRR